MSNINLPLFNAVQQDPPTARLVFHCVGLGYHITALLESGMTEEDLKLNIQSAIAQHTPKVHRG